MRSIPVSLQPAQKVLSYPPDEFQTLFEQNKKRLARLPEEGRYNAFEPLTEPSDEIESEEQLDEDQAIIYELERDVLYYSDDFAKLALFQQLVEACSTAFIWQLEHDPLYAQARLATESGWLDSYHTHLSHLWDDNMGACACHLVAEQD